MLFLVFLMHCSTLVLIVKDTLAPLPLVQDHQKEELI